MKMYTFLYILHINMANIIDMEKIKFCSELTCDVELDAYICGIRSEQNGFRLRLFKNECELLKYGCSVNEDLELNTLLQKITKYNGGLWRIKYILSDVTAYGLINKEYCDQSFVDFNESSYTERNEEKINRILLHTNATGVCTEYKCINEVTSEVCGIRQYGVGFKISLFDSKCEMDKYNCENAVKYNETDLLICKMSEKNKEIDINDNAYNNDVVQNITNFVVVNGNMLDKYGNLNDSIDNFFAASHVLDLPVKEVQPLNTRKRLLKYAGPIKVFVPWIVKPKNISNDTFHMPTLSSCYHKCPTKCPDTYAPVCGVPGIVAREPSIMFQNHCFMDVAQCKMFWEGKSSTAHSSSYVETSFLFCMGDEMNAVYRFLPAIRTLQHMGRLKKKGKFRAKLRNFRYVSEFRSGRPKFMG